MNILKAFQPLALILCFTCIALLPYSAMGLEPDEIALIVNSNMPEGVELAQFYAQQRHIPDNRILVLDLPKTDSMPCRTFEDMVVPQAREFLVTGHLAGKIKCFVTFYGVPLAIDARINTPAEADELTKIRMELIDMAPQVTPAIKAGEAMAVRLNDNFKPDKSDDLDHLLARNAAAQSEISSQLYLMQDPTRKAQLASEYFSLAEVLLGDKAKFDKLALAETAHAATQPSDHETMLQLQQHYQQSMVQAAALQQKPDDPAARAKLRQIVHDACGLIMYINVLRDQADYLATDNTGASFDSELSMIEWTAYPHKGFWTNPIFYGNRPNQPFRTLMVTRLDAPQPETVKSMITNSIQVEQKGLTGQVVIDALGIKPGEDKSDHPGWSQYDQSLRDLAGLLKLHTKLKVTLDDTPNLLPAGSQDDVALYCGWYSVRNYVPCCKFNPGAVGYHIASYELISLRQPGERGWVHGLLNDGVVGTVGAVAEPYLGTFPHPSDFFPLLLTGKLTLAEVYWKTTPVVSWMQDCVGDPLYNPYKTNPQLVEADLPTLLRLALKPAPQSH